MEEYKKFLVLFFYYLIFYYFLVINHIFYQWDFFVYILNSLYFRGIKIYCECYRPPLLPIIFSIIDYRIAYLLALVLFLYTSLKLLGKYWYFLFIPLIPFYLFQEGSEIFALSLLNLGIIYEKYFFLFLFLSFLARYDFLIFSIIKYKDIFFIPFLLISSIILYFNKDYFYYNSIYRRFDIFIHYFDSFLKSLEFKIFVILSAILIITYILSKKNKFFIISFLNFIKSLISFQFRIRYLLPSIFFLPLYLKKYHKILFFVLSLISLMILKINYIGNAYYKPYCEANFSQRWVIDSYFCNKKINPLPLYQNITLQKNFVYVLYNYYNIKTNCSVIYYRYYKIIKC